MIPVVARAYPHVLALALAVGLAAANVVNAPGVVGAAAVAIALAAVAVVPPLRLPLLAGALLLAGLAWGAARLESLDASVLETRVGATALTVAEVTGTARRGAFALRVPATVRRFDRVAIDEPVLLELPLGRAPPRGARLELVTRVKRPRAARPGDRFDEREWLARQGVSVVLTGGRWRIVGRRGGIAGLGDRLRAHITNSLRTVPAGERRALVAGIVLGEDEGLSERTQEDFRASGLYHLLAVSGQNIALIAVGVLGLAWLLGISRLVGEIGVLAAIGGYVLAVGWQPSVVRAGVAGCLASLAWLAARPRDRWYFLLLGAIVLLAWNPASLLDPGFQLSFAAVAAIFTLVPVLRRRLEGYPLPPGLRLGTAISLACGLATAPILWLQFGSVPLFSVLSNALALPVVGSLLGLGLAGAAVEPVLPGVAGVLGWLNGWLAAYLALCARLVAGLPFAEVDSGRALAVVAGGGVAVVGVRRLDGRRRLLVAALAVPLLALAIAWRFAPSHPAPPAGLRLVFLDVGQGDAVLAQVAGGAVLVDQGPPEGEAAAQLKALGVRRLSLLVLTHPQRDHIGGAADVIRGVQVDRIIDPRLPSYSPDHDAAIDAAHDRDVPVGLARAGTVFRLGRLRLRLLWPDGAGYPNQDPNERAVVMHLSYGEVDALLTADAESDVTVPLRPPAVEILKVAHHGSADEQLPRLLELTRPRIAVISVGRGNDYGHPAPSTLASLAAADGLRVLRTDEDGRVTIETDGRRIEVREER